MKTINSQVYENLLHILQLHGYSYDVSLLYGSMIQITASVRCNMFSYTFLQFIEDFCKKYDLIYYVSFEEGTGLVYLMLHKLVVL